MITPIYTMRINEIIDRQNDLLVSAEDIKEMARNERVKAITEFAEKMKRMCDSMISEEHNYHAQPTSWASAYEEFKEDIDEIATELKGE